VVHADQCPQVASEITQDGVGFGDGIWADSLRPSWRRRVKPGAAPTRLQLIAADRT
jgi:hypothetical protein